MSSSLSFFSDPLCGTRESANSAWNWYQFSIASTSEWSLIQTHVSFQTSFEAFAFQFNQRRTSNMMLQKFKFPCLLDTTDELLILNSQYFTPDRVMFTQARRMDLFWMLDPSYASWRSKKFAVEFETVNVWQKIKRKPLLPEHIFGTWTWILKAFQFSIKVSNEKLFSCSCFKQNEVEFMRKIEKFCLKSHLRLTSML